MASLKISRFLLLLLHTTVHGQYTSTFLLSSIGTSFQPANMIELLDLFNAEIEMDCLHRCNQNVRCRTVDYDSNSKQCRHFEGEVSTGTIITSNSSSSQVVAIEFSSIQYASYNQTGSQCQISRYLVIDGISNRCMCPSNTFWNGSMCLNQLYNGSSCESDEWCRMSLNLICDPIGQRCVGSNITTTTTTTSTTTKTTSTTTTKTTSTTTTTISTTTKTTSTTTTKTISTTITTISTTTKTTSTTTTKTTSTTTTKTTSTTTIMTSTTTTTPVINYNRTFPAPIASPNAAAESRSTLKTIFNEDEYRLFLVYGVNLLINGNAETGPCDTSGYFLAPTSWSYVGDITQIAYNNDYKPELASNFPGPR